MISRRRLLITGASVGVGVLAAGMASFEGLLPGGTELRRALERTGPAGTVPNVPVAWDTASTAPSIPPGEIEVEVRQLNSAARGRPVTVIAMVPSGTPRAELPVCLALHGRGDNAEAMVRLGLPQFLSTAVRGRKPFAIVAVDGGDATYWVAHGPGDDPQAMLADELPGWLAGLGLSRDQGRPRAALGISMGCFGALVYHRRRAADPLAAVATLSPALFRSWGDASSRHVFGTEAEWAADEPLRHLDALPRQSALGVWCGRQDPFWPAADALARQAPAQLSAFTDGQHDADYWRHVLPDALTFVSGKVR